MNSELCGNVVFLSWRNCWCVLWLVAVCAIYWLFVVRNKLHYYLCL